VAQQPADAFRYAHFLPLMRCTLSLRISRVYRKFGVVREYQYQQHIHHQGSVKVEKRGGHGTLDVHKRLTRMGSWWYGWLGEVERIFKYFGRQATDGTDRQNHQTVP
jgi:hypothetical protein